MIKRKPRGQLIYSKAFSLFFRSVHVLVVVCFQKFYFSLLICLYIFQYYIFLSIILSSYFLKPHALVITILVFPSKLQYVFFIKSNLYLSSRKIFFATERHYGKPQQIKMHWAFQSQWLHRQNAHVPKVYGTL